MEKTREERIDAYVNTRLKSSVVAFLLTLILGPIGYLYVSVGGGLLFMLMAIGLALITPPLALAVWLMCVLSAPFGVSSHNKKVRAEAELLAGS